MTCPILLGELNGFIKDKGQLEQLLPVIAGSNWIWNYSEPYIPDLTEIPIPIIELEQSIRFKAYGNKKGEKHFDKKHDTCTTIILLQTLDKFQRKFRTRYQKRISSLKRMAHPRRTPHLSAGVTGSFLFTSLPPFSKMK